MEVRTRIAPSPTGFPHLGTIYQSMFDYYFAKKYGGKFVVRLEDTDQNRFVEGAEEVIYSALTWFGLEADESPFKGGLFAPYRQSERLDLYKSYAEELVKKGHGYFCFCSKERLDDLREKSEKEKKAFKYDRVCLNLSEEEIKRKLDSEPYVVRMKIPENRTIVVNDALVGKVEFDSNLIDDQVILKSDGFPTYHLAVVVDDYLMKITHIFRGREWLPSTPKHILLYEFFDWNDAIPVFVHLPLILNSEGAGKLSKRHGHASVDYYRDEGFFPEAVLNYLMNIVWNNPTGEEIYPADELMNIFSDNPFKINVTSQGAKFDLKKLEWMNAEYIRAMGDMELAERLTHYLGESYDEEKVRALVPLVKERMKKLADFKDLVGFLFGEVKYKKEDFESLKIQSLGEVLSKIILKLNELDKPWKKEGFEKVFQELGKDLNLSNTQIFQLLRLGFSGLLITPPLFETMQIEGEKDTIHRIEKALDFVEKQ